MKRYYLLIVITLGITGTFSYMQTADRSLSSLLINTLLFSIPLGLFFLYTDYALTILHRYHLMKFFYLLALFFSLSFLPVIDTIPVLRFIRSLLLGAFFLSTVAITVSYFLNAAHARDGEQHNQINHPMHVLADAYQKQKESKDPWEAQMYDFFAEKVQKYIAKRR